MREILFRGKGQFNNKWIEGYYREVKSNDPERDTPELIYDMENESWMIDPDTLSQYTGLIDANGQKIFDGDILQFGVYKLIVYWNDEAFQWQAKKINERYTIPFEPWNPRKDWTFIDLGNIAAEEVITGRMTTVVIGNIYDDKDLIEDETVTNIPDGDFTF